MRSPRPMPFRRAVRALTLLLAAVVALASYPIVYADSSSVTLSGSVQIQPEYAVRPARDPLDLVVVFDASVSQNWTADGYGTLSPESAPALQAYQPADQRGAGHPIHCADPRIRDSATPCQESDAWHDETQRRLYRVKHALGQFLDRFPWQSDDRAALVTFNGGWANAAGHDPASLTAVYPSIGLTNEISRNYAYGLYSQLFTQAATSHPGSSDRRLLYRTSGAAPGALGLRRAQQVFDATAPAGPRTRAVLFIADGMLNVTLDGTVSADERLESNFGENGPVAQALAEADALKTTPEGGSLIFTLGLTQDADNVGLSEIASSTHAPFFQNDSSLENLDQRFASVIDALAGLPCTPALGAWQVPALSRMVDASGQSQSTLGTVEARDAAGSFVATAAIQPDGTWELPGLAAQQTYNLSLAVGRYVGDDGVARTYNLIAGADAETSQTLPVYVQDSPPGGAQTLAEPVRLRVGEDVCAALSSATPTPTAIPPTPTAIPPTATTQRTATWTATATTQRTATWTATAGATSTQTPKPSVTATATVQGTATRTATSTLTPKPSATATATSTITPKPNVTATATRTATITRTATNTTRTATNTRTVTATATASATRTPTAPPPSATSIPTETPLPTETATSILPIVLPRFP